MACRDAFDASALVGRLIGTGFSNWAFAYLKVYAHAINGGNNLADLYDSSGVDAFTAASNHPPLPHNSLGRAPSAGVEPQMCSRGRQSRETADNTHRKPVDETAATLPRRSVFSNAASRSRMVGGGFPQQTSLRDGGVGR